MFISVGIQQGSFTVGVERIPKYKNRFLYYVLVSKGHPILTMNGLPSLRMSTFGKTIFENLYKLCEIINSLSDNWINIVMVQFSK